MTKQYEFNWQIPVPEPLLAGDRFDRWSEDGSIAEPGCVVKVDSDGFFIYWKSDQKEGQVIECSQVSDVRLGCTEQLRAALGLKSEAQSAAEAESRTLTVCSGLDFVNITNTQFQAKDAETAEVWVKGLRKITHNYKANNVCPVTQLKKHWLKLSLMVNAEGYIPVKSVTRTFASGKVKMMIMQCLVDLELPGGKNEVIDPAKFTFEKFYELYHKICPRTDIEELFKEVSYHKNHVTASQFMEFLNERQRDPRLNEILFPFYDKNRVMQIIQKYETDQQFIQREWLSYDGFCRYLMSDENAPVFLDRLGIHQDMDKPLAHYYINSSHNTYLVGRQFGGRSSVEMYRQVLLAGCRCVELDCWDGPNNEPIITHGKAMCTDICFKDVICAIKETAFVTSEYPVILSFENHCTKHQQYLLAKYCEDILGDLLLKEPLPDYPLKPGAPLPSPNLLKRKILIKNKRLKPEVEREQLELFRKGQVQLVEQEDTSAAVDGEETSDGLLVVVNQDENQNGAGTPDDAHPEKRGGGSAFTTSELKYFEMKEKLDAEKELQEQRKVGLKAAGKSDSLDEEAIITNYQYTSATTNIHPYLSRLINYTQPVKFQGFEAAEEGNFYYHMSSFNESAGLGLLKNHAVEFVNYNKRQMSRIYPKGGRVDSSNNMPQIFWNAGCQMVALNFQTSDLAMQLNQGKFEYNGNCGYLLKPDFMRRPDRTFDPFSESPVDGVIAAHCSVQVISGQFLSDRKIGTYVEVDMYGLPTDTIKKEFRTKTVPNNGLNPVYNEEPFVFRKIILPDLAVLRIAVYEDSGKLIGQRILPLDGLQAGYRHISLRTEGNFPLSLPTVFCRIVLKTYVPDGLSDLVDALSDPRRYLSLAEKRAEQMKSMGIDESDIGDVPLMSDKKSDGKNRTLSSSNQKRPSIAPGGSSSASNATGFHHHPLMQQSSKADGRGGELEVKFEPLLCEQLRLLRPYQKLHRTQQKELAQLRKKHGSEKQTMHKQHAAASAAAAAAAVVPGAGGSASSVTSGSAKASRAERSSSNGSTSVLSSLLCHRSVPSEAAESMQKRPVAASVTLPKSQSETEVRSADSSGGGNGIVDGAGGGGGSSNVKLMLEQTRQWTEMLRRQGTEEQALGRAHLEKQHTLLEELAVQTHADQRKHLLSQQEKESKELQTNQAKISLSSRKSFSSDKTIKNKAEVERRIKEMTESNAKKFSDERHVLASRHLKQQELLQKSQAEELRRLQDEFSKAMEECMRQLHPEAVEKIETAM